MERRDVFEEFAREFIRNRGTSRRPWRIDRILVPIDFSVCSLTALEYAEDVARAFKAELVLVHVEELPLTPAELIEVTEGTAARELTRLADHLRADGVESRCQVRAGAPADEILETAEDEHVGLIVVGTHGRRGVRHLVLGSVAEQLVRKARCPVLTVRPAPGG